MISNDQAFEKLNNEADFHTSFNIIKKKRDDR